MSDYENNGCFCLDELTDGKASLKRLTDDLKTEYPVFLEKRDSASISELHITVKALWNEFSSLLHSIAEYDSGELYRTALKLFDGLKRFDYLGGGNYPALISALYSFSDMLPDKAGIDAKAAAHLMNRIKMGYFPTDEEHVRLIKQAINFPKTQVNILDPCCGEGLALKVFAENENAETYGIELDESRGHTAQKNLNNARLGSFFHSSVPFGRFHALFLNPPYLSCPGENGGRRMERAFLSDTLPLLMRGGLLVYIIPYHRADSSVCRTLATYYKNLSVFRFRAGEFKKYKQIVFFGIRTEKHAAERTAEKIERLCLRPEKIPLIDTVPKGLYSLPVKETAVPYFKGSVFDVEELAEQLKASDSLNLLFESADLESRTRKPLLPLNLSQIGLVGASGLMNGLVDSEHPHVIKGKIIRKKTRKNIPCDREDVSGFSETESNKIIFNVLTQDRYITIG